jgi:hypothetical protein
MFLWNRFCKCRFSNDTPTIPTTSICALFIGKIQWNCSAMKGWKGGAGISRILYKFLTKLLRSSYKALTKLLRSSYEALTKLLRSSYEALTKLLRSSYEALTKLLRSSYEALTQLLWRSFEALTKLLRTPIGLILTPYRLLVKFWQTSWDFWWASEFLRHRMCFLNFLWTSYKLITSSYGHFINVLLTYHKLLMNFFRYFCKILKNFLRTFNSFT